MLLLPLIFVLSLHPSFNHWMIFTYLQYINKRSIFLMLYYYDNTTFILFFSDFTYSYFRNFVTEKGTFFFTNQLNISCETITYL